MLVRINEKNNPLIRIKSALTTISKNPVQNIAIKIPIPHLTKILPVIAKIQALKPHQMLLINLALNPKIPAPPLTINQNLLTEIKALQRLPAHLVQVQGNAH